VEVEDHASSGVDESDSDDEAAGLKNTYSVGDLVGELSCSDNDTVDDVEDCDSTLHQPDAAASTVPVNGNGDVGSERPIELQAEATHGRESTVDHAVPDSGDAVDITDTYSRVYDEVLTENIYQEPAENDDGLMASK